MFIRANEGQKDCKPIIAGFSRTFCDLRCIKDAVRVGDQTILDKLEEGMKETGKNTDALMEYYTTSIKDDLKEDIRALKPKGSSLLENVQAVRGQVTGMFAEMRSMLSGSL